MFEVATDLPKNDKNYVKNWIYFFNLLMMQMLDTLNLKNENESSVGLCAVHIIYFKSLLQKILLEKFKLKLNLDEFHWHYLSVYNYRYNIHTYYL